MTRSLLRAVVLAIAALSVLALACTDEDPAVTAPAATGTAGAPALGAASPAPQVAAAGTLKAITDRGQLKCGVNDAVPGFGFLQPNGQFAGFDTDFCRALAAAVLGDSSKVEFIPLTAAARFEALSAGQIDVLIRNTTWTTDRDVALKATFATTTFYDGQGLMVRASTPFQRIQDMSGATICVLQGTTTEQNLNDRFRSAGVAYTPLTFENLETLEQAFVQERCDGWTSDKSQLAARRSAFPASAGGPQSLRILAETFSKEPLGPLTREGDSDWEDVVRWVVQGTMAADEFGVTAANVDQQAAAPASPEVARLLGAPYQGGAVKDFGLGIPVDGIHKAIKQVGNYNEIYERNIAPLGLTREGTLNASWQNGGLIYALPFR